MEALTIGEIVAAVIICNTLWSFIERLIEKNRKPHKDLEDSNKKLKEQHEKDILEINKRIDILEENGKEINQKLGNVSNDVQMLMKTNLDMMEHMVTGNHQQAMKQTIKDVQQYLVERE